MVDRLDFEHQKEINLEAYTYGLVNRIDLNFVGIVEDFADLPLTGNSTNDAYYVRNGISNWMYIWNGAAWAKDTAGGSSGGVNYTTFPITVGNKLVKSIGVNADFIQETGINVDASDNVTGMNDLTITGDFVAGGDIAGTTVNATTVNATTANISGTTTTGTLSVTNNATIGGNLGVTGTTTTNTINATTGNITTVNSTTTNSTTVNSTTVNATNVNSTNGTFTNITVTGGITDANSFGGNGSDGIIDGTTNVTIAGTNDTYIVKNYSSIVAGGAPRTFTITPTGCVLHIKVSGNADLTNWTFNFAGKGGQGGAAAVAIAGPGGVGGAMDNHPQKASGGSSAYAGGESIGGTLALTTNYYRAYPGNIFQLAYVGGAGGGGGAGSQAIANLTGNGGNGGGCVILEIAGNVIFNTTTFNMAGTNGAAGFNQGAGQKYWSGGGGGGGGGAFIYYQGTLTGAPTNVLTGGTGAASIAAAGATGTPGQPGSGGAGAGAAGGNSVGHIFAVGGATGAGGVGGVGLAVLKKVNTF